MKKCAVIYKKGEKYYAHADSKTKAGFWVADEPFLSFNISDDLQGIIMQALSGSQQNKETSPLNGNLIEPLLRLAKVKSFSTFAKNAKMLGIEMEEDNLSFLPYRNEGAKQGFSPINEKAIKVKTDEDLKKVILEAFEMAV